MPKSRFNAVREKARASRHNPIHKSNGNGAERTIETPLALQTSGKAGEGDVLPVLKSLPLPGSKEARSIAPEDVLWALNSLTSFLASKTSRNELLQAKHDIVSRIVLQLHGEQPIEVRDAASGCLRNICVEAAGRARKGLEAKSCIEQCVAELKDVASSLGLIEGGDKVSKDVTFGHSPRGAPAEKPFSEMNRKERRQAAKAQAASAKKTVNEQSKPNGQNGVQAMETEQAVSTTETIVEDDKTNTKLSHLTNLAAVLWCLTEMSPEVVQYCESVAPTLCLIFSRTLNAGIQASTWLTQHADVGDDNNAKKINVGRKDQRVTEQGRVDAAIMALNALVTLSDSNATVCAAFVGISRQELFAATKGKGRKVVLDNEDVLEANRRDGQANLTSLRDATLMLSDSSTIRKGRTTTSLGLLALAVIRNIQSSLPSQLKNNIKIRSTDGSHCSLTTFETNQGLPYLQQVVTNAANLGTEVICRASKDNQEDDQSAFLDRDRYRHDDVNNLNLALEVAAELVSDRDEPEALDDVEEEIDDVMNEDDESDKEDGMIDVDQRLGNDDNGNVSLSKTHVSRMLRPALAEALCRLAFSTENEAYLATEIAAASSGSAVRGVIVRALSVLNNATLALSSHAHPPPSQPVSDDGQAERIAQLHRWLAEPEKEQIVATIWRWSFELASTVAASPLLALSDTDAQQQDVHEACAEARRIVEVCIGVMWNIARCYEGVSDDIAKRVLIVNSETFRTDEHCKNAVTGAGVVSSLVAAYRGSKKSEDHGKPQPTDSASSAAGGSDGVRVACLGVLSTLARLSHVWPEHLSAIATLLADCLEALQPRQQPDQQIASSMQLATLNLQDWTSLDGMVIAVNGMIDTFADETRPWDGQYAALKLQGRLKRVVPNVRAAARTIDKRRQASLRLSADEAWENLNGFVQYRDSL